MIWINLALSLALPMTLGLLTGRFLPRFAAAARLPLGRFAVLALLAFVVVAVIRDRELLLSGIAAIIAVVVIHNAAGLALGYFSAALVRLDAADRKALTFETGMQNSGLALAIIGTQFDADVGMVIVAGLWGIWHMISGFTLARFWRVRSA